MIRKQHDTAECAANTEQGSSAISAKRSQTQVPRWPGEHRGAWSTVCKLIIRTETPPASQRHHSNGMGLLGTYPVCQLACFNSFLSL